MNAKRADSTYCRDLGNGLWLRWSTSADTEALVHLVSSVFRAQAEAPLNTPLGDLTRELMSGTYPLMGPGDFALVEDRSKPDHPLVACVCLWRHTWEYEGIPFALGRPEIVATDPAYRHRGLIRAIFKMIHARSEVEGHLAQVITGIPYFYRRFEYEYALDLRGSRITFAALIPQAQEGIPEPFALRDANWEDIPLMQQWYDQRRSTSIVSACIDEVWWRYQLSAWRTSTTGEHWHIQIIVNADGQPQGYLITQTMRRGDSLPVVDMAFARGANIQAIMPSLLRALVVQGRSMPAREYDSGPFNRITFGLGGSHPVYDVLDKDLIHAQEAPYAWYVRVADLPSFIRHIAPALETRLAHSAVAGYSGELTLDFYLGGLHMLFEHGKLIAVEDWKRPIWDAHPDGRFPPLTFLQMLFGYRSLDALRAAFPDVRVNDSNKEVLLKTLFPSRASWVLG